MIFRKTRISTIYFFYLRKKYYAMSSEKGNISATRRLATHYMETNEKFMMAFKYCRRVKEQLNCLRKVSIVMIHEYLIKGTDRHLLVDDYIVKFL